MKVSQYNPSTMTLITGDVTGLDFGSVRLGSFCANTLVIKPVPETENLTAIGLFLEDRAEMNHTRFGAYKSSTATTGINPGDTRLNTYLMEAPGVSDYNMYSGYRLTLNPEDPEYVWLDTKIGLNETTTGDLTLNYRFVIEYD
jgi:hypothetical protein